METETQERSASAEGFLRNIPLFEKCSPQDIHKLALSLRSESYDKGDTILFQGMISNQLFIVASGVAAVYSRRDKITRFIANLERGAYFGEISLVKNCAATATVKSGADGTEVFSLDYDVIKEMLEAHGEVKADLEAKIIERNRFRLETFEKQKEEVLSGREAAVATTY